jgi:hypothetical protein
LESKYEIMSFDCLANLAHIPPGGWKYRQAESGLEIYGGDYFDLKEKVRMHRQTNQFGPTDLDQDIQAQLCSRLPVNARAIFCRPCVQTEIRSIDLEDVTHFLKTAASWIKKPRFVSQAEANSRAEICASCPKNVRITGCTACRNLIKWSFEVIGHRNTPFDSKLGACEVCGCGNAAQVHLPLEVLKKGVTKKMVFPDFCWKKSLSSQSAPPV